ncbi:exported hypothetical protein [Nitrosotalea sinensis]|jgi:hypothetical protein|uniref:Uncharacterized protein n=1 Tax=Nitrosotalea sinensis TaxID=1499975 RepID=A0A2H1EGN5_9ARCH|nr:hypothetical protein [Candidatus Nitrosotalea sinensis]SHO45596.1 exported hypothetical protein [Candidatus Nitrosotalea sinensis]
MSGFVNIRKYYDAVYGAMVSLSKAELAGIVVTSVMIAMICTNSAFAQQQPCGEQPYVYNVGCLPLNSAQMYAAVIVGGIIALAVGCGASGIRYSTIP